MKRQQDDDITQSEVHGHEATKDVNASNESDFELEDIFNDIFSTLETQIPDDPVVKVKSETSSKQKIEDYNNAIIKRYLEGEAVHLKVQKPVGIIIAVAVGLQLIAFNVLIYLVTLGSHDLDKLNLLLDFMKYYTGAVIVEMLGLCFVVVKAVFSMSLGKMVEHIVKKKK